jgi:hypothetical protein
MLIKLLKKLFGLKVTVPQAMPANVGPYGELRPMWDDVVAGKFIDKISIAHHERNFLRGLHHPETVKMVAQQMADATGSRVLLASAYIDSTPLFTWTPKGAGSSVNGEIGDILLIAKVFDGKNRVQHYASFLQAKVTNQPNDVDRHGNGKPIGSSTVKELGLYHDWPPVHFKSGSRLYDVNPGNAIWPHEFSHFLTISQPDKAKSPQIPVWTVSDHDGKRSPFAVFGEPKQSIGAEGYMRWLRLAASDFGKRSSAVELEQPQSDFDHLVVDILNSLLGQQKRGKVGHSGGVLVQHAMRNIMQFGAPWMAQHSHFGSAVPARDPADVFTKEIPDGIVTLPPSGDHAVEWSERPMLVVYMVIGPEGRNEQRSQPPRPMKSKFPGAELF